MRHESPIFFAALSAEFLISLYKKRKLYALDDSISSLSCGAINASVKIFMKWLSIIPYTYIYDHFSCSYIDPTSIWSCLVLFLAVDCVYYWMHREMHMVNIGWAGHATHHSSEYLNFTTAVRQSVFGQVFGWIFYLPLAIFFPPHLYALHYSLNLFFQMWIHTELVGKVHPIIEFIFNTPSHHRVHHARNPEYLDKNFAGVLIIWDRAFGTFAEEKTTPIYGLVHPLQTWDAIWAQFHHLVYIFQEASKYSQISHKIAVVFAPPGWTISEKTNSWIAPEIPAIDYTQSVHKTYLPGKITTYLVVRFLTTLLVFNVLVAHKFPFLDALLLCGYITFCVQTYSLILDKSVYAYSMEVTRTTLDLVLAVYFFRHASWQFTIFLLGCYVISAVWLARLKNQFEILQVIKQKSEPMVENKEEAGVGRQ